MSRENSLVEAVTCYLAEQPDVMAAYVFGSVARGRFRSDSDLDVAVRIQRRRRPAGLRLPQWAV